MKFADTGLKPDATLEAAFDYAYAYEQRLAPRIMAQIKESETAFLQDDLNKLDVAHNAKQVSDNDYTAEKEIIKTQYEEMINTLPQVTEKTLDRLFSLKINALLELQNYAEKSSPTLLAASLLRYCVDNQADYQYIGAKFGSAVSGLIAEILDISSHPETKAVTMPAASSDAKRILIANLTGPFNTMIGQIVEMADQLAKLPPGSAKLEVSPFPDGLEKYLFGEVKLLWGNDKKLEAHLVNVFNTLAPQMSSDYRIEVNAAGTPDLFKKVTNAPAKPAPGPK